MIESNMILWILAFVIVAVAANQLAGLFVKIKLPHITGLLLIGIVAGPFILSFLSDEKLDRLQFVNDTALAFIAYAAGSELYLLELRSRFKSIRWNTFGQLVLTFVLSAFAIYYLARFFPFMRGFDQRTQLAIALLAATIFVARSPASAIAIVNEVRAKGPFTQTVMGVTVLTDVLVIILFTVVFSVAASLIHNETFNLISLGLLLVELFASGFLGYGIGKMMGWLLQKFSNKTMNAFLLLGIGYLIFLFSHWLGHFSDEYLHLHFYIEPLLVCIIASFVLTNYTPARLEFREIIDYAGLPVYVSFFTLTGANISLDVLEQSWAVAIAFFLIRLISMVFGAYTGARLSGDPEEFHKFGWMPYVTQAGVGLGLVTVVSEAFPSFGIEFESILIAVIVMNQILGPPLFKWVLDYVGESHKRHEILEFEGQHVAYIFGWENQAVTLARQLASHNWTAHIVTRRPIERQDFNCAIHLIENFTKLELERINADKSEAWVMLLTDAENLNLCEIAFEHFGIKDKVVRLNKRENFNQFHALGALIVEPNLAIVSLLDQYVRSPLAASLLLGTEDNQGTIDLVVQNPDLHGLALRNLKFPPDVLILSINRGGNQMMSHGYTRLRMGDVVTVVGSNESLENLSLRFSE